MVGYRSPTMELPWSSSADEDQRFKRILKVLLIAMVLFGLIIPFIPVPEPARDEQAQLPPQLARVILEKQELPPPPPEPPKPEEPKPEEPKPEEPPPPPPEPEPTPEPVTQPQQPDPSAVARARERAAASGLLQMRDELQDMRSAFQPQNVETTQVTRGESRAAEVDRSRITSQTTTTSGGVRDAELSRDAGGAALSGRETTQVESTLASGRAEEPAAASGSGGGANRTSEEVRRVIDQHMGAIFSIYNRALRQNPALQGKVVVRLVIEPGGTISNATIVSSELNDPELEARLIARILLISFPAANVARTTVNYTFDFLPQ